MSQWPQPVQSCWDFSALPFRDIIVDYDDGRRIEKQQFYETHNFFLRVTLFCKRMFYESYVYYSMWYTRVHDDDDPSLCLGLYPRQSFNITTSDGKHVKNLIDEYIVVIPYNI